MIASLSRRRWARRGRALADFVLAFSLTGLGHIIVVLARMVQMAFRWAARGHRGNHRRQSANGPEVRELGHACLVDAGAEPPESASTFRPLSDKSRVRFNDVAGLEEAKREILLRLVLPVLHRAKARQYGIRTSGGLLLYGPPGTGKTKLARAVASEIDAEFYHVRPCDIMSAQVGKAEANIAELFRLLRRQRRVVLFIDEVEALIPSRRRNGSTIMQRVISQILSEVDGLTQVPEDHVMLLIGATNEPDMIDPAMMRPGRFDAKVYVGPPDLQARKQILAAHLKYRPIADDVDIETLSEHTEGMTGAQLKNLVERAADRVFLVSVRNDNEAPLIAGADLEAELPRVS